MSGDEAFAVLRRELGRRSQSEIAKELGVSTATLSRWARLTSPPGGANLSRLVAWSESLPPLAATPAALPPVEIPADYWRGVLYAAEAMSETLARLLRESRQSAEALAPLHAADGPIAPATPSEERKPAAKNRRRGNG